MASEIRQWMKQSYLPRICTILRAFQIETKEARQKNNHQIRVEKCGEVNSETDSRR